MYILHVSFIDGVMVSVLASGEVDCGSEPQSGQTKDYEIGMCCFSTKREAFRIRIICPSGATYMSADCCFSKLAQ